MLTKSKPSASPTPMADDDDAPPLTRAFFENAEIRDGNRLVRRGRPPLEHPKVTISIRLDADLLNALRATGEGWQTRVNSLLRRLMDAGELPT